MSKLQKSNNHQNSLPRSRSRANSAGASIRRGEIQISEPIPIATSTYGPSVPQSLTSLPLQSNPSLRHVQTAPVQDGSTADQTPPSGRYTDSSPKRSPPRLQHKRSMEGLRQASNPIRNASSHSPPTSSPGGLPRDYPQSKPGKGNSSLKREKSTLRTVMRRLFGRRTGQGKRSGGVKQPAELHRSVSFA